MEVVINVKGMSCKHCEKAVTTALRQLTGVKNVDVNIEEGEVDVNYDKDTVSLDHICDEIEALGYDVVR